MNTSSLGHTATLFFSDFPSCAVPQLQGMLQKVPLPAVTVVMCMLWIQMPQTGKTQTVFLLAKINILAIWKPGKRYIGPALVNF